MKTCSKCKVEKPFDQFPKRKNGKNGLNSWCKDCWSKYYQNKCACGNVKSQYSDMCQSCYIVKVTGIPHRNSKENRNN